MKCWWFAQIMTCLSVLNNKIMFSYLWSMSNKQLIPYFYQLRPQLSRANKMGRHLWWCQLLGHPKPVITSFSSNFLHVYFQVLCILLVNGNKTRELIKLESIQQPYTPTLRDSVEMMVQRIRTTLPLTNYVKSSRGRSKANENLGWVCAVGALKAVYPVLDQAVVHFAIGNYHNPVLEGKCSNSSCLKVLIVLY